MRSSPIARAGIFSWFAVVLLAITEAAGGEPPWLKVAALPSEQLATPHEYPIEGTIQRLPTTTDVVGPAADVLQPPVDWRQLMRPRFALAFEWEPATDGLGLRSYDASVSVPTYPFFGPPPPFLTAAYSLTEFDGPGVPSTLHDLSLGVAWIRPLSQRWTARFTLAGAFATDLENVSGDAWQLRAGAFAMYRPNERWTWAFGALATGREDLPVLPGVGVVWLPRDSVRFELMMPRPRIAFLLAEQPSRQHWGYVGAAISGGTWAFRPPGAGAANDQFNYREFRLVLGYESSTPRARGSLAPPRSQFLVEAGLVFGRELEFESATPDISFGEAFLLRTGLRF